MKTQYDKLSHLLTRPGGCTAVDVMRLIPSTAPHKRLSDMFFLKGWEINKRKDGKLIRYTGKPPKVKT